MTAPLFTVTTEPWSHDHHRCAVCQSDAHRITQLEAQLERQRVVLERIANSEPGAHYVSVLRNWARSILTQKATP